MSYENCREAFDSTIVKGAILGHWQLLQDELYRWQIREYGLPRPELMALGVVEELGELADAQGDEDMDDAIADAAIYAIQLGTAFRLDAGEIVLAADWLVAGSEQKTWGARGQPGWTRQALGNAGRLCHVVLKASQGIRGMGDPDKARRGVYEALACVFAVLVQQSAKPGDGASALYLNVVGTAARVMTRRKADLPQVVR